MLNTKCQNSNEDLLCVFCDGKGTFVTVSTWSDTLALFGNSAVLGHGVRILIWFSRTFCLSLDAIKPFFIGIWVHVQVESSIWCSHSLLLWTNIEPLFHENLVVFTTELLWWHRGTKSLEPNYLWHWPTCQATCGKSDTQQKVFTGVSYEQLPDFGPMENSSTEVLFALGVLLITNSNQRSGFLIVSFAIKNHITHVALQEPIDKVNNGKEPRIDLRLKVDGRDPRNKVGQGGPH